jgi:hypothetical protein
MGYGKIIQIFETTNQLDDRLGSSFSRRASPSPDDVGILPIRAWGPLDLWDMKNTPWK